MKHYVYKLIVVLVVTALAACGSSPENQEADSIAAMSEVFTSAMDKTTESSFSLGLAKQNYQIGEEVDLSLTFSEYMHGYISLLVIDQSGQVRLIFPGEVSENNGPLRLTDTIPMSKFSKSQLVALPPKGKNAIIGLATKLPFNLYYKHCVFPRQPVANCSNGSLVLEKQMVEEVLAQIKDESNSAAVTVINVSE